MQCELCGIEANLIQAEIEGTLLNVCRDCARFGKVVEKKVEKRVKKAKRIFEEKLDLIAEDCKDKIKNARESIGLKQKELAERIGEKESVIHMLESGKIKPSVVLAKKFEKFLNIKLIEEYEDENIKIDFKDTGLTVGDLIKIKKKK